MRRKDREITDLATMQQIVADGHVITLGINNGDAAPYIVPTNYGYQFDGNTLTLYMHGAPVGKKRTLIAADNQVSFNIVTNAKLFEPTDDQLSHYSYYYQSIYGTGTAVLVSDLTEKETALRALLRHEVGHDVAGEISQHDLAYVGVIRLDVTAYTAKQHVEPTPEK